MTQNNDALEAMPDKDQPDDLVDWYCTHYATIRAALTRETVDLNREYKDEVWSLDDYKDGWNDGWNDGLEYIAEKHKGKIIG